MIIKDSLKTIALSLIALSFIGVASAWTEPTSNPPAGNTSAPLLTEPTTPQTTTGTLQVNGLRNVGGTILDGNVGIGTGAVPTSKLEVKSTLDEILRLTRDGGTYPTIFRQGTDDTLVINSGNKDALTIKSGNVGIGTIPSTGTMLDILNGGDIYEKSGSTCDAGDVIIAYKTTSNTCSRDRSSCSPNSCTTGAHDWSTDYSVESCSYRAKAGFSCSTYGCLATQSVKCQKPKTALKINNGFSDIFRIDNKDASFGGKVGIGISNPAIDLAIGDTDTGFKWNSDGNISLRTNNQNRMTIDKDGIFYINGLVIRSGGNFDNLTVDGNTLLNNVNFDGNSAFNGDVRINNPYAVNEYGTDGTGIKGYLKLNVSGKDYVVPLYNPLMAWVNKVSINYVQSDPDGNWATEQTKSWTADKTIDGISVYGSSDDGGYCYAYWSTGHVERYRHNIVQGDYGYYNVDNKYYNPSCDDYGCGEGCPSGPSFDNSGNVKICQEGSGSGNFAYGTGSKAGLNLAAGTVINVKARHVIGRSSDSVNCYMDVKYK